jgi:hypothetical protein
MRARLFHRIDYFFRCSCPTKLVPAFFDPDNLAGEHFFDLVLPRT